MTGLELLKMGSKGRGASANVAPILRPSGQTENCCAQREVVLIIKRSKELLRGQKRPATLVNDLIIKLQIAPFSVNDVITKWSLRFPIKLLIA